MYGVVLYISTTSLKVNLRPASLAMAGKCKAAFVDPPVAATTLAAFTKDSIVTMSLGLIFLSSKFIIALPLFSP